MGWFIWNPSTPTQGKGKSKGRSASKGKAKGKAKADARVVSRWTPDQARRAWHLGWSGVALLTLGVGWVVARGVLIDYHRAHDQLPTDAQRVVLIDAPGWLDDSISHPMRAAAAAGLTPDPFDAAATAHVAASFKAEPWIKHVRQVRRLADGRVEVHAEFRTPLIAVRDPNRGGDHYLVDAQGVVLAGPWGQTAVVGQDFRIIENVAAAPPALGQTWPGEDVQAALQLAVLIAPEPFAEQVNVIHLAHAPHTEAGFELLLYTDANRPVLWGAPAGQALVTELVEERVKLDNLRTLYRNFGRIDSRDGTVEVNRPGEVRVANHRL